MKRKKDIGALVDDYREHGAQEDRDQIVLAAEPIIRSIIARLTFPSTPLVSVDELYNVGVIAILQALDSFEPLRGASFVTYGLQPCPRRTGRPSTSRRSVAAEAESAGCFCQKNAGSAGPGIRTRGFRRGGR